MVPSLCYGCGSIIWALTSPDPVLFSCYATTANIMLLSVRHFKWPLHVKKMIIHNRCTYCISSRDSGRSKMSTKPISTGQACPYLLFLTIHLPRNREITLFVPLRLLFSQFFSFIIRVVVMGYAMTLDVYSKISRNTVCRCEAWTVGFDVRLLLMRYGRFYFLDRFYKTEAKLMFCNWNLEWMIKTVSETTNINL